MNERLTKDISRYQSYCQFELKDCRYKDIYNFEHYSELEENVDCDLTLGIDKLGEYEDIDTDPKHLSKIKQAFEIVKEKPQATLWLIQRCDKEMEYEDMISLFKEDITKEQFGLLKEVLL